MHRYLNLVAAHLHDFGTPNRADTKNAKQKSSFYFFKLDVLFASARILFFVPSTPAGGSYESTASSCSYPYWFDRDSRFLHSRFGAKVNSRLFRSHGDPSSVLGDEGRRPSQKRRA